MAHRESASLGRLTFQETRGCRESACLPQQIAFARVWREAAVTISSAPEKRKFRPARDMVR